MFINLDFIKQGLDVEAIVRDVKNVAIEMVTGEPVKLEFTTKEKAEIALKKALWEEAQTGQAKTLLGDDAPSLEKDYQEESFDAEQHRKNVAHLEGCFKKKIDPAP